jgi:hypothetical protein
MDVARAKTSIEMTVGLIAQKRRKMGQLEMRVREKSQERSTFVTRVVDSLRGSLEHQGIRQCEYAN